MIKTKKVIKLFDKISSVVGKISSWSIMVVMILILFEVISRRIFNSPTIWTVEIITMIFGFHFMMVAGYGLLTKSMVSVDVIYERFSVKTRAIIDIVTYFVFFMPFVLGVLYGGYKFAASSWAQMEVSWSAFGPPVYPIKTVIPVAMLLLLLQGVSEIMKRVVILKEGEEIHD